MIRNDREAMFLKWGGREEESDSVGGFLRHNNVYLRERPERAVLEEGKGEGKGIVEG